MAQAPQLLITQLFPLKFTHPQVLVQGNIVGFESGGAGGWGHLEELFLGFGDIMLVLHGF